LVSLFLYICLRNCISATGGQQTGFTVHLLAIDPGCDESAYVIWDTDNQRITHKGKVANEELLHVLCSPQLYESVVIEMIASYGMAVGKEVFETCVWIGKFTNVAEYQGAEVKRVLRQPIKLHHCHSNKANDSNVRTALVDKYGPPGTKKSPNPVYNDHTVKMAKDIWAAFALATYCSEHPEPKYFQFFHN
jgi:hypothetical protein